MSKSGGSFHGASDAEWAGRFDRIQQRSRARRLARPRSARILSGLIFMLPIVITFWIVYRIYEAFRSWFLDPAARFVNYRIIGRATLQDLPDWWQTYVSPVLAIVLALLSLYVTGYFVRSAVLRAFDWMLLKVPVVTVIYKAVRNLFQSLNRPSGGPTFKRVVLVDFPNEGSRALAFVTKTLRDVSTSQTILCLWVITGVVPPAGFTLFVPESKVTDVEMSVNETLQIILSYGITAPATLRYYSVAQAPSSSNGETPVDPQC